MKIINSYFSLKNDNIFRNTLIILSFLILSFLSIVLLMHSHFIPGGWDLQFHFRRIMELKESIKHNNMFPTFSFNQFHGSVIMGMYPYFNLLPIAILAFFIKSKITLVYVSFIFNSFLTFIISFYSNKSYTKSNFNAYIFSIVYSLSNLFISYYFLITDFGIISTFTFLPLIIFGFINILSNKNKWVELSLGMSFLLLSHILNVLIITILLSLWLIINLNKINKRIILNITKAIILFLLLTSIVWIPMLKFIFNNLNGVHLPVNMQLQRINLLSLMSGIYGGKTVFTIGFFPIITIFIIPSFYNKLSTLNKQMYWISLIIITFSLLFPFELKIFSFLDLFQQTYRFLIIPIILLSIIFSSIINIIKNYKLKMIGTFGIIFIALFLQMFVGQYKYVTSYSNALTSDHIINKSNHTIDESKLHEKYKATSSSQFDKLLHAHYPADDDYMPKISIDVSHYVNKNIALYNNQHKIQVNHSGYNTFNFIGKKNINKISLPLYAYNEQKLNVYLNDQPVNYYANKDGLLTIDNIRNHVKKNNKIYVKEAPNRFKIIGIILSILGWLFVLILFIKNKFIKTK